MNFFYLIMTIIILLLLIVLFIYNIIITKENNVKNAYSSLDIMLKKRYDLIPNLISCVKLYMKQEEKLLEEITNLRSQAMINNNQSSFILNNGIEKKLDKILLLSENYPKLRASENFLQLQQALSDTEEYISAARRTYNAHVTDYNTFISIIPINIIAQLLGFKKEKLFEINVEEKNNKVGSHNERED